MPLIAYQVAVSDVTCSSAVISWQTNGPSTSQAFYDTVSHDNLADYAHNIEGGSIVVTHSVSLIGLSPGTTYFYAVKSVFTGDGDFLVAVEDDFFTTLAPATIITIVSPPNGKLPAGQVGVAYSHTLVASGGMPAYTWSILSGRLPCGLSLNASTGVISGTPIEARMFNFTVWVTDTAGTAATAALRIKIITAPNTCTSSGPDGEVGGWQVLGQWASLPASCLNAALSALNGL